MMKIFTKRLALVTGLLFTALMCCGIVYIDSTSVFWQLQSGIVKLYVSNSIPVIMVDTNTQRIGIFSTNTTFAFEVLPRQPSTNGGATGQSSALIGGLNLQAAKGGDTIRGTTATGGAGGTVNVTGGDGGEAPLALTNYTGGIGGGFSALGGTGGGATTGIATNNAQGGNGGAFSLFGGPGGSPTTPATNTIGGNGGTITISSGNGGTPTAGWSRKGGGGGTVNITAGNGGASVRTNATSLPGNVTIQAGSAGAATTAPGNPVPGGAVTITAGAGATGPTTNSDGGHVFIAGGAPGPGAVPGNVVLARDSSGAGRGAGVQIGPLITGGSATITNVLGAAASLDFPSTVAGTFSELTIAVTGVTSNNVAVSLSVPWQSAQTGGAFVTFNSNDVIYVRFINNQLVTAIDPEPGVFAVVGFRIR